MIKETFRIEFQISPLFFKKKTSGIANKGPNAPEEPIPEWGPPQMVGLVC